MFFKLFKKNNKAKLTKKMPKINTKILIESFKDEFNTILSKISNLEQSNIKLAHYHKNKGDIKEAIFRLKLVIRFWPNNDEAKYLLALCYYEQKDHQKAANIINKISLNDENLAKKIRELTFKIEN